MLKRSKGRRFVEKACLLLLASSALCAIAQSDKPPVAQCESYLTMSAAAFSTAISNKAKASAISAALSSCEKYNVCSQLNGITKCSALLFNRGFDSDLAFNSASGSNSSNSASANTNYGSYFQGADNNNNNSNIVVTKNKKTPSPAYIGAGNAKKTKKESINWF